MTAENHTILMEVANAALRAGLVPTVQAAEQLVNAINDARNSITPKNTTDDKEKGN